MKTIKLAMLGIGLMMFCGCTTSIRSANDLSPRVGPKSGFVPPGGVLFSNYKAPLLVTYDAAAISRNQGDASSDYIYDPFLTGLSYAWGDCSLNEAIHDGRFNRVGSADYSFFNVLGIYKKTSVHVYEAPTITP